MTTTANKGYITQGTGDNPGQWGTFLNDQFISTVDANLGGQTSLTLTNLNVTLDATQVKNVSLRLNGMLTGNVVITNPAKGFYVAENLTTGSFTVSVTNGAGSPVIVEQNFRAVLFADSNGVRALGTAGASNPVALPVGTQVLFAQAAVPTGWTLSAALNDYAIKIGLVGGTTSGVLAFSTVFALTVTGDHTLTLAEMATHTHNYTFQSRAGVGGFGPTPSWRASDGAGEDYGNLTATSTSSGGGGAHNHTADMRIKAMTTIIGVRAA